MQLTEFLITALVATAIFTLGALIVTWVQNEESCDPILLKRILTRLGVSQFGEIEHCLTFAIRYSVSLISIFIFEIVNGGSSDNILYFEDLLLNILSGIFGIQITRLIASLVLNYLESHSDANYKSTRISPNKKMHTS